MESNIKTNNNITERRLKEVDEPFKEYGSGLLSILQNNTKPTGLVPVILRDCDSPIFNLILKSNIFQPFARGYKSELVNFKERFIEKINKNKYYVYVDYIGYNFNLSQDLPLYCGIINLLQSSKENRVEISENDFLKKLGLKSKDLNIKRKSFYRERIKKMSESQLIINIPDFLGEDLYLEFPLINTKFLFENKKYYFIKSNDLIKAYNIFSWRAFDMNILNSINKESAKKMYCFYETKMNSKIKNNNFNIKKDKVSKALSIENKENKEINRVIKESHNILLKNNVISSYNIGKDKINVSILGKSYRKDKITK